MTDHEFKATGMFAWVAVLLLAWVPASLFAIVMLLVTR